MSNPILSSSNRTMFETVSSLKKQLNSAIANSNTQDIKIILNKLRKEVVPTDELIRTTKIGISVGKQRQNSDPEISKLAKLIVNEWKNGVKKEPGQPSTGHQSGSSKANSTSNSTSKSASSTNTPTQESKSPPSKNLTATSVNLTCKRPSIQSSSKSSSNKTPTLNPRSSKTEPNLDFDVSKDKVRDGSMRAVFDALVFDSDAPIEEEVNQTHDSQSYKSKMRSLICNLKDKNNPGLREAVVSGELSCKKLCSMGPADMASEERKAHDRKLAEENLFKARGAAPQQAETDGFRCGRCGQRKCTYYQMQTRSADEPMTTFVTCVNCNNRWKFS
ncbi:transcription elongation factor S-II [Phakopsora pachyrhizi]|uniref:Transcription elongation factor n=2 Tax=Phakopsora pachyrhizi TaxID=170000 RepID=A0AAV0AKJ8_PHAPC|nr:transcription elongation factor S-II [Phakopsora pachyrhizi]